MALFHYQVELDWNGPGAPGLNVWDIRTEDLTVDQDLPAAVDAIRTFYLALAGGGVYPAGYTITFPGNAVNIVTREDESFTPPSGLASTTTDPDFAGLLQMILTIRTSSRTRSGRGRKFLGPVAQNVLSPDGTPLDSTRQTVQTAASALLDASSASSGWAVGVYSRTDGVFRDATALVARDYFAHLSDRGA